MPSAVVGVGWYNLDIELDTYDLFLTFALIVVRPNGDVTPCTCVMSPVMCAGMFDYNSQAMGGGAMNGDNGEWRQQRDHRRKSRAAGGGQHLQDGVVGVGVLSGASYPYTGGMGGPYSGPGDGDEVRMVLVSLLLNQ